MNTNGVEDGGAKALSCNTTITQLDLDHNIFLGTEGVKSFLTNTTLTQLTVRVEVEDAQVLGVINNKKQMSDRKRLFIEVVWILFKIKEVMKHPNTITSHADQTNGRKQNSLLP